MSGTGLKKRLLKRRKVCYDTKNKQRLSVSMMKKTVFLSFAVMALNVFMIVSAYSQPASTKPHKPAVNILEWWSEVYPNDPYVKAIEKKCGVRINTDESYTNNEFLQRLEMPHTQHDIIIFNSTLYQSIKKVIAEKQSDLYQVAKQYYRPIRHQYFKMHYAHNVVFYQLAIAGILYNPSNMQPTPSDSILSLFKQANDKLAVLIDDPVEGNFILNFALHGMKAASTEDAIYSVPLTMDNFKKLYQGAQVIITNLPEKIVQEPNFAFAYQWSGNAIGILNSSPTKLKFLVNRHVSYIASDLLATLNNRRATLCVAHYLSARHYLNHKQRQIFYFSPFGGYDKVKNANFQKILKGFLSHLHKVPWINSVPMKQYQHLDYQWQLLKLNLAEQSQQNQL